MGDKYERKDFLGIEYKEDIITCEKEYKRKDIFGNTIWEE